MVMRPCTTASFSAPACTNQFVVVFYAAEAKSGGSSKAGSELSQGMEMKRKGDKVCFYEWI